MFAARFRTLPRAKTIPPSLSIVVPTYKRPVPLTNLLAGLVPQARRFDARIIIVNDGSHDAAYDTALAPYRDDIVYSVLEQNMGRGQATNHGIGLSATDWVLFTDDDVIVPPDWIDTVAAILARYPQIDVVGGRCVAAAHDRPGTVERFTVRRDVYLPQPHLTHGTVKCLITACLAVRRETLTQVGGLDSDFPCGQDHNLTWRLRHHGAAIHTTHRWWCGHDQNWSVHDLTRRLREYAYWHVMQSIISRDPVDYDANPAMRYGELARRLGEELQAIARPDRYRGLSFRDRQAFRYLDLAAFLAWNSGGLAAAADLKKTRTAQGREKAAA